MKDGIMMTLSVVNDILNSLGDHAEDKNTVLKSATGDNVDRVF